MPNQIPNTLPGGPVNSLPGFVPSYIYYFRGASANNEQWYYFHDLLGFGYGSSSTLEVYFRGAKDVNAVDKVTITLLAGTDHTDAAEYILNAPVYQQVAPTYHHIIRVTGNNKFRPEFVSATITYGECCGGGRSTMDYWILSDGSTTQQIDNTETVTFADSTFINHVVSATNTLTTSLSATGTASGTTFLRGDNTWATPATGLSGTLGYIPKFTSTTAIGDSNMANPSDGDIKITGTTSCNLSLFKGVNERLLITASDSFSQFTNKATSHMLFKTSGGTNALTIQESNARVGINGVTGALSEFHVAGNITMVDGNEAAGKILTCDAAGTGSWATAPASGASVAFKYINTPAGSFPEADVAADTLVVKSVAGTTAATSSSVHITGDSTLDSVDFQVRKFESFVITLTDENRVMTTGDKYRFRMPYDFILADYGPSGGACQHPVKLHVNEPPASGDPGKLRVNIYKNTNSTSAPSWTTIFTGTTGRPEIEDGEYTSVTATQQSAFTDGSGGTSATYELNCDDELKFEVDTCTGDERGLKVILIGYQKNCQG